MDLGLQDAAVVVTGGTAGMGRATAECYAHDGARVAVLSRTPDALNETVAALRAAGSPDAVGIPTDLSQPGSVDAAFYQIGSRWGYLNVLVNTVGPGATIVGEFDELDDTKWDGPMDPLMTMGGRYAPASRAATATQGRMGANRQRLGALGATPITKADRLHRR